MSTEVPKAVTPVQACLSTKREAILEWLDLVPDPFFHELETSIIKIVGEAGGLNHGVATPTMNVIKTSTHLSKDKAPAVESVSSTDVLHKGIMACRWKPANLKHPVQGLGNTRPSTTNKQVPNAVHASTYASRRPAVNHPVSGLQAASPAGVSRSNGIMSSIYAPTTHK